jgi:small-conductance mechanosensitive channel
MWIDEVMNQWLVLSDMRLEVDKLFKKENITIPFPQRTLWINNLEKKEPPVDDIKESENKEKKKR